MVNIVLAILSRTKLPKVFWGETLLTTSCLWNKSTIKDVAKIKTPYKLWFGRQPNLSYLRVFGRKVHVFVPKAMW